MSKTIRRTPKPSTGGRLPMGLFTANEAIQSGIPRVTFYRMVRKGAVVLLDRGIYQGADAEIDHSTLDLAIACKRFGPASSIGGLTALFRYGLTEQVPTKIWVLVPPSTRRTGRRYRVIRTNLDPNVGIEESEYYRIADIERALVEALRYTTKIGLRTAIRATREALKSGKTTEAKLMRRAKELGLENFVLRQWDAIVVE